MTAPKTTLEAIEMLEAYIRDRDAKIEARRLRVREPAPMLAAKPDSFFTASDIADLDALVEKTLAGPHDIATVVQAEIPVTASIVDTEPTEPVEYRAPPASPEMQAIIRASALMFSGGKRRAGDTLAAALERDAAARARVAKRLTAGFRRKDREAKKLAADLAPKTYSTSQKRMMLDEIKRGTPGLKCLVSPEISGLKCLVDHSADLIETPITKHLSPEIGSKMLSAHDPSIKDINEIAEKEQVIAGGHFEPGSSYILREDTKPFLRDTKICGDGCGETPGPAAPENSGRFAPSFSQLEDPFRDGSSCSETLGPDPEAIPAPAITAPALPRLRRGKVLFRNLPLETRSGFRLAGLRSLVTTDTTCVDVSVTLSPRAERSARCLDSPKIATEARRRQSTVSWLHNQLSKDFAALGLPCSFCMVLRETYVSDEALHERRRTVGLSRYRLEMRMTCVLPVGRKRRRALVDRLQAHFGEHTTDECKDDRGPIRTPGKDLRRFTGRSFSGDFISMTDDVANAGKLA